MSKISFVYFDVGGVVARDFSASDKWDVMKKMMGISKDQEPDFDKLYDQIEQDVCKGKDIDSYLPLFREKFKITVPPDFSWVEYFADHIESNPSVWPAVEIAKQKSKVGLLTDQYPRLLDLLESGGKLPPTKWDVVVDSTIVGFKKPMKEIFDIAQAKSGVAHDEILFIENSQINYQASLDYGWQSYFYDSHDYEKSSRDLLDFFTQALK